MRQKKPSQRVHSKETRQDKTRPARTEQEQEQKERNQKIGPSLSFGMGTFSYAFWAWYYRFVSSIIFAKIGAA